VHKLQYTIEIKKHQNKDYTIHVYENMNYFCPVFTIKRPTRWNKCVNQLGQYLTGKKFINIFQKSKLERTLKEVETLCMK
jgi:hypothetical protein